MVTLIDKTTKRKNAISNAKRRENKTNIHHYAVWCVPDDDYIVTDSMPMMGEWYDADGIRHG